jgi:hypothetical protein
MSCRPGVAVVSAIRFQFLRQIRFHDFWIELPQILHLPRLPKVKVPWPPFLTFTSSRLGPEIYTYIITYHSCQLFGL